MKLVIDIPELAFEAYKKIPINSLNGNERAIRNGTPIFEDAGEVALCLPSCELECKKCGFRMPTHEKDGSLKWYKHCPNCGITWGNNL